MTSTQQRCPNCKRMQPRADVGLHAWEAVTIRGASVAVCSSCASNLFAHAGQAKGLGDRGVYVRDRPWDPPTAIVAAKPAPPDPRDRTLKYYDGTLWTGRYCGSCLTGSFYLVDVPRGGRLIAFQATAEPDRVHRVMDPTDVERGISWLSGAKWADGDAARQARAWAASLCRDLAAWMRVRHDVSDRDARVAKLEATARGLEQPLPAAASTPTPQAREISKPPRSAARERGSVGQRAYHARAKTCHDTIMSDFPVGCRVRWTTSYPRTSIEATVVGHTRFKVQISRAGQSWPTAIYPCHLERIPTIADTIRANMSLPSEQS